MHLPREGMDNPPPTSAGGRGQADCGGQIHPPPPLSLPGEPAPSSPSAPDTPTANAEILDLERTGPRAAHLAAALTFFALIVIVGAVAWFHFSNNNGGYPIRLTQELRSDARIAAADQTRGLGVAIAPSWPLGLYDRLRRDILLYAAVAAVAAWLWSLAVRARARRDAYIVYNQLKDEIAQLRASIETRKSENDSGDTR